MPSMSFLLKCDISGIQSFIFDTPTKGAAKELKGRSFYVQALSEIALEYFKQRISIKEILYNGGGNFYAFFDTTKEELNKAIKDFQEYFIRDSLYPFFAFVKESADFGEDMESLNTKIQEAKLRKKANFDTFEFPETINWKDFTEDLVRSGSFEFATEEIKGKSLSKAGVHYVLSEHNTSFKDSLLNKLPIDKKRKIIDFDDIAKIATGDKKLAALKMDVDNLGNLFRNQNK